MSSIPAVLTKLLRSARVKHYPKGQIILYEGDVPTDIYIVKTGVVKIYDIDEQGNEKVLHVVKSPGIIPFIFFSGTDEGTHWFYTALNDCDLYVYPKEKLVENMAQNSELATYMNSWFSREIHELLVRLSSLGKTNAQEKIIAALKFLAVVHSLERPSGWRRVTFPVSHQLLADMTGVTRESAAVVMKELQDNKVVRNPRLTVLEIDFKKLIEPVPLATKSD